MRFGAWRLLDSTHRWSHYQGRMCSWEPLSVTCLKSSVHILPRDDSGPVPHFSRVNCMIWRWPHFAIRGRGIVLSLAFCPPTWPIPFSGACEIAILYFAQIRSAQEEQVSFGRSDEVEGLEVEKCSWPWRGPGARPERVSPGRWGAGAGMRLRSWENPTS